MHIIVSSFVFISTMLALFGKDWTHIRYQWLLLSIFHIEVRGEGEGGTPNVSMKSYVLHKSGGMIHNLDTFSI